MLQVLLVMTGGAIGSAARYGVSQMTVRLLGTAFPWGTLIVNLCGCFLIGLGYALADREIVLGPNEKLLFMTGFLGGLTTFSSYGLESINAINNGVFGVAVLNIILNNVCGLLLVLAGIFLVKFLIK